MQWLVWLALLGVPAVFVLRFLTRRKYARILGAEHFREIAHGLGPLRDRVAIASPEPGSEAPRLVTTAGATLTYRLTEPELACWAHDLGLTFARDAVAPAAGFTLLAFAAERLGLPAERLEAAVDPDGGLHVVVLLTSAEHAAWEDHPVEVPADQALLEAIRRCLDAADQLGG